MSFGVYSTMLQNKEWQTVLADCKPMNLLKPIQDYLISTKFKQVPILLTYPNRVINLSLIEIALSLGCSSVDITMFVEMCVSLSAIEIGIPISSLNPNM